MTADLNSGFHRFGSHFHLQLHAVLCSKSFSGVHQLTATKPQIRHFVPHLAVEALSGASQRVSFNKFGNFSHHVET